MMRLLQKDLLIKFVFTFALVTGLVYGFLSPAEPTQAQMEPQTFLVQAGSYGPSNIELLIFAPQTLQVHRGDTVVWSNNGFHNIRFADAPADLVIVGEMDGAPLPQINPAVAFPTIENGAVYQGGDANSGLPLEGPGPFALTMDLEPGTYSYLCDVHPGMVGIITVVDDETGVPTPGDVAAQASQEIGQLMGAALGAAGSQQPSSDPNTVIAGGGVGQATVQEFLPPTIVVGVGETVNWQIFTGVNEPHTISWPPIIGQDVAPIPQEGGPPILALGDSIAPLTMSGAEIRNGDMFSSGLLVPGQTFSLTFTEPGAYPYICNLHPGMTGTVVVMPGE